MCDFLGVSYSGSIRKVSNFQRLLFRTPAAVGGELGGEITTKLDKNIAVAYLALALFVLSLCLIMVCSIATRLNGVSLRDTKE